MREQQEEPLAELPQGTYPNEEAAFKAVDSLRKNEGIWPGVVLHADGSCSLTRSDPRRAGS